MEHIYQDPSFGQDWFTYPNLYSRFVNELQNESTIVEVGCWKGKSIAYLAVEILNSGKNIKIDAVDTWKGSQETSNQEDPYVVEDKLYPLFLKNIFPLRHLITPIRMDSLSASELYEDLSVDVVFIDASHEYEDVKADIKAWFPKVKIGGYISGHDYPGRRGVRNAVDEIFKNFEKTELCWVYKKTSLNYEGDMNGEDQFFE